MILLGLALVFIRALPIEPALLLARLITVCYLALRKEYREEIRRNYQLLLGRSPPLFWVRNGWRVGRNLGLMAQIGTKRGTKIVDSAVVYRENNNDGERLEQNLHIMMASFHFGLWEFLPQIFARRGYDVGVLASRQRDGLIDRLIQHIRKNGEVKYIHSLRDLIFRLSRPGITGFMLDNTTRGAQTIIEIENGGFLRLPILAFKLAARIKTKVIPVFCYFSGGRLRVKMFPEGDGGAAVDALVRMVKERPEEWVFWAKSGALTR
ncbi:MAG: hypothetical protein ABIK23_06130 [candidate division WOR-3 bacterium]